MLPLPAPATLGLLEGAALVGVDTEAELVTPTGAAIAATLVEEWGALPPLTLEAVGYGAGTKDLADRPNVVRVVLGAESARPTGRVVLLETNLDDFSPELVPDAVERCFAAGALDVWTVPAQMKKGRPGFVALGARSARGAGRGRAHPARGDERARRSRVAPRPLRARARRARSSRSRAAPSA